MPKGTPKNGTGGQFKKGEAKDDPRRNNAGQRSREVVATAAQARELYVRVLHEPINTPPDGGMTNLELIVRQHVAAAKKGDAAAREQMLDRIWGKAIERQEISGPDGSAQRFIVEEVSRPYEHD